MLCLAIALVIAVLTEGLAPRWPMRQLEIAGIIVVAVAVLGLGFGLAVAKLADYSDPEDEREFDRLVEHSEELARENLAAEPDEGEFLELDPYDRGRLRAARARGARRHARHPASRRWTASRS